jgi:DNA-binding response OmpR family regulator
MDSKYPSQSIVLLVENDELDAAACTHYLQQLGTAVHVASSIGEARKFVAQITPDTIVLGHNMDDGNALDCMKLLRQLSELRSTPIILLTHDIDTAELERAVMLGIYAYISRPFEGSELMELVGTALLESAGHAKRRNV